MTEVESGRILIVDDEADVRRVIADALREDGHEVTGCASAEEALDLLQSGSYDLAFVDITLPGMSGFDLLERQSGVPEAPAIVIITGRATVGNAVEATRRGAYDYVTKPFDLDAMRALAREVLERRQLSARFGDLKTRIRASYEPGVEIVGQSPPMQEIYKLIGRVAASTATVLIQGQSGTGKELIARALHAYSDRWEGPFVAVNCSAIPADLLESEMFGHERGAFTGATERRIGKFEQAIGGTLFLDEISELPFPLQAKLLRVLQEREFTRVGGRDPIPANCRIITATNKQMAQEVAAGRFREDLYFRLKVVVIDVPSLGERKEDIPLLVEHFLEKINRQHKFQVRGITDDALARLIERPWPGNVRELENVLIRAAALAPNRVLTAEDVERDGGEVGPRTAPDAPFEEIVAERVRSYLADFGDALPRNVYERIVRMVERPLIEVVLDRTGGNQLRAAEILGINRNTLRKKCTELGIDPHRKRS
ncbi:MAG: sigma-54-dependent Fis family transcriptional regulator [Deltaproteobacteria bacterium]|nr:MAG: sigma-54-dependent Fis family transcriptional regulator [Deltaproteobacteria bacterium]